MPVEQAIVIDAEARQQAMSDGDVSDGCNEALSSPLSLPTEGFSRGSTHRVPPATNSVRVYPRAFSLSSDVSQSRCSQHSLNSPRGLRDGSFSPTDADTLSTRFCKVQRNAVLYYSGDLKKLLHDEESSVGVEVVRAERESYNLLASAMFCLKPSNPFRMWCFDTVSSKAFETATLVIIVLNSLTLAFDIPATEDNKRLQDFLLVSEYIFQSLFTIEMLIKMAALGVVLHPHAYLRGTWNAIDFVIVMAGFMSLIPGVANVSVLRLLRVIRPLRTVSRVAGMRTLMNSIVTSIPTLLEVFLLLAFLVIIFAITGMSLFSGKWNKRCYVTSVNATLHRVLNDTDMPCSEGSGRICEDNGVVLPQMCTTGDYKDEVLNFDTIFNALLLVFKIISLDDWPEDMQKAQNATGFVACLYFIGVTVVGAYFCINLVLAILSSVFSGEAEAEELDAVQLASLLFRYRGKDLLFHNAVVTCPCGHSPPPHCPSNVLDNRDDTKWMDYNLGPLVIELRVPAMIDQYTFVTAKDAPQCDPVQWVVDISNDCKTWKTVHMQLEDYPTPVPRMAHLPWFTLPDGKAKFKFLRFTVVKRRADQDDQTTSDDDNEGAVDETVLELALQNFAQHRVVEKGECEAGSEPSANGDVPLGHHLSRTRSFEVEHQGTEEANTRRNSNATDRSRHPRTRRATTVKVHMDPLVARAVRVVVRHRYFNLAMLIITLVNIGCMAMDRHGIDETQERLLDTVNFWCSIVFAVEMLLKWVGLGLRNYFRDRYNTFDCVLVLISIPEIIMAAVKGSSENLSLGGAMSAFRAFRLARVARLAQRLTALRVLLETIGESVVSVAYLFLIMLLFIYIFGILGLQIFNGKYPESPPGAPPHEYIPEVRNHFSSFPQSLLTVFVIITGENWATIMKYGILGTNWGAMLYFVVLYVFGNYVLLNLFVAILIYNFSEAAKERDASEDGPSTADTSLAFPPGMENVLPMLARAHSNARQDPGRKDSDHVLNPLFPPLDPSASFHKGSALHHSTSESIHEKQSDPPVPHPFSPVSPPDIPNDERPPVFALPAASNSHNLPAHCTSSSSSSSSSSSNVGDEEQAQSSVTDLDCAPMLKTPPSEHEDTSPREPSIPKEVVVDSRDDPPQEVNKAMFKSEDEATSAETRGLLSLSLPSANLTTPNPTLYHRFLMWVRDRLKDAPTIYPDMTREEVEDQIGIYGKSLHYFEPNHPLRLALARVVLHPFFNWGVIFLILVNVVFLALDDPSADNDPSRKKLIEVGDIVFTVLFCLEAVAKMVTLGLYDRDRDLHDVEEKALSHDPYLNNTWNRIDLFVCVTALLGLGFEPFKLFRSLRAVRLIILSGDVRVLVLSLFVALPQIAYVCLVCSFTWLIFGILGVQLFKGTFYHCNDPTVVDKANCTGSFLMSVQEWDSVALVPSEREWVRLRYHFDNVGVAMLTLFEVAAGEGWAAIMYSGIDSSMSPDKGLSRNANPALAIYFVVFVIVGGFFAINLFVGMLIEQFGRVKALKDGSALLSESQQEWVKARKLMSRSKLSTNPHPPTNPLLLFIFEVVTHPAFDHIVMGLILLNVAFMCIAHDGQPPAVTEMLYTVNIIFVVIFTVEAVLKILAFGPPTYFGDNWNRFDFLLVVGSYVGIVFGSGSSASSARILRIGRVFRLVKRAKSLQKLFVTLMYALPSLWNISLFLFVIFYIFGVMGVSLFGRIRLEGNTGLSEYANFRNLGTSIVLLYTIATTESWTDVMDGCMITPQNSECDDSEDCGMNCCGTTWAILYFLLFMIFGSFAALNLFITVLLDQFQEEDIINNEQNQAKMEFFKLFRDKWSHFDHDGVQVVPATVFIWIVRNLPEQFMREIGAVKKRLRYTAGRERRQGAWQWDILKLLESLEIPVVRLNDSGDPRKLYVRYVDAQRAFALQLCSISPTMSAEYPVPECTAPSAENFRIHHFFAAWIIMQAIKQHSKKIEVVRVDAGDAVVTGIATMLKRAISTADHEDSISSASQSPRGSFRHCTPSNKQSHTTL